MVRCEATCLVILGGDIDGTPSAVEHALRAYAVGAKEGINRVALAVKRCSKSGAWTSGLSRLL